MAKGYGGSKSTGGGRSDMPGGAPKKSDPGKRPDMPGTGGKPKNDHDGDERRPDMPKSGKK